MSKISLSPNILGTGTLTIASPNTDSDRVLNLPDTSGTLNTSGAPNEVPAGTVSAPAIYPTGDTNTGIFFPAADTIAFTEGGAEVMRIASSGNVGIGTSSPTVKLDVNGAIKYDRNSLSTGGMNRAVINTFNNNSINNTGGSIDNGFVVLVISQGNGSTIIPIFQNGGGGVAWTANVFNPGNGTFSSGSNHAVSFATAGTGANQYTLRTDQNVATITIQRTSGSAAYTVAVNYILN
jgi:hypothetical protein